MVEGRKVLKQLTKMVQHKFCKACTFFTQLFGKAPLKMGGVRWSIELEMCTQVNKIGLPRLYNEYLTVCHQQNKSKKSSKKLLDFLKCKQNQTKSMVQIAAVVDVGTPLISIC